MYVSVSGPKDTELCQSKKFSWWFRLATGTAAQRAWAGAGCRWLGSQGPSSPLRSHSRRGVPCTCMCPSSPEAAAHATRLGLLPPSAEVDGNGFCELWSAVRYSPWKFSLIGWKAHWENSLHILSMHWGSLLSREFPFSFIFNSVLNIF